jgi:hypothetical protein
MACTRPARNGGPRQQSRLLLPLLLLQVLLLLPQAQPQP